MTLSSFCYMMAYLTGLAAFVLLARRRGLATEGIMDVAGAGLIGGLLGANLGQWACAAGCVFFTVKLTRLLRPVGTRPVHAALAEELHG